MDMKSFALGMQAGKNAGGGTVEGVHFVTFMSEDGTTELYKRPVADGDNCADPVDRELIEAPTKESTAQYDYSFVGWATTPNGAWDESALDAVTEDRTVYATFAAVAKIFTVRFLDGDTVLSTAQVAYGSQATPPDTEKEGYTFEGWTPSDLTVYGDTDFVGTWTEIKGYFFVTSVEQYATNAAINNAGTTLVTVSKGSAITNAVAYDLSGDTPTQKNTATISSVYPRNADFSHDDNYCIFNGVNSNKGYLYRFDKNLTSVTTLLNGGNAQNENLRYSPANLTYAYQNSSGYGVQVFLNGTTQKTISPGNSAYTSGMEFSPDGTYIALANDTTGAQIYKASDGSLVRTISADGLDVTNISYNADGSRIALALAKAPYFAVYDTSTGAKILDLSEYFTAEGKMSFVPGTNELIVGVGTSVRVFDVSGSTPQEVENIPAYAGSSISFVRTNKNGTRVVIGGGGHIEVWGKAA